MTVKRRIQIMQTSKAMSSLNKRALTVGSAWGPSGVTRLAIHRIEALGN